LAECIRADAAAAAPTAAGGALRRWWTVWLLAAVSLLAGVDRQSFAVLLAPIQKDLRVDDAAMGVLTGSAFAVVYSLAALPLARFADRVNRRNLLTAAIGVWSLATGALGFVGGYLGLLGVRAVVASAESPQLPVTMSLIADNFPPERRGMPISCITVGTALGYSVGSFLGGFLSDRFNWHVALMVVGFPGLLMAVLVRLTITEPARGQHDGGLAATTPTPLGAALAQCARIRTLWFVAPGTVFIYAAFSGWLIWMPPFLMRVHHLTATRMGEIFGFVLVGSTISNPVTGFLSDRLARISARWRLHLCSGLMVAAVPLLIGSTLVPDLAATVGLLLVYNLVSGGITSASQAAYISVAPARVRAFVFAVIGSLSTVFGSVGGPLLFGLVNDRLKLTYGDQSLRYTMLLMPAMLAVATVFYLLASRSMDRDVEAATGAA
jgi:predicted MFS family arabinose efflux permease